MFVSSNGAKIIWLNGLVGTGGIVYRLYTNNPTITAATVLSDFVEASWPDYVPQPAGEWSPATIKGGLAVSYADKIQWTRGTGGSPVQVHGYFATTPFPPKYLFAEARPDGPIRMAEPTDVVVLFPEFFLS